MKIKIGMVGTSQLSFPGPKEATYQKLAEQMAVNAKEMDFDLVVYPTQVITEEDGLKARAFFEEQKIDFLMMCNVSYSSGHLVPIFYRTKGCELGIWSIPEPQRGVVMFNSFCSNNMWQGINAKYLRAYNRECKWFYGMADDERFRRRLAVTVKALGTIKKLKQSRVALIGGFAPGFNDLYFDERSVFSKLDGIYINRLHEYDEIIKRADKVTDKEIAPYLADIEKDGAKKLTKESEQLLPLSLRLYVAYRQFIDEYKYDAIAVSCWPKFQDDYKYSVCSTIGMLNDDKFVAACEGDLMSAISMLALQEMSGDSAMCMDFSAFDEKDDSLMMWHCGPASKKFCKNNGYNLSNNWSGMAHEPGKICGTGVVRDMEFDEMPATVFRFSGDMEGYLNLTGRFMGKGKNSNCGSRGWLTDLKLNNKPITALNFTNTILSGGFEHHYAIAGGSYGDEVAEMNKWLGIKPLTEITYADYLQNKEDEQK